jgi:hypothetical protein
MEARWDRDLTVVAVIALAAALLLCWIARTVGVIAVADGQGWDGSVFVRVIQEIVAGAYTNSDPYRTIRTVAFPAIYAVEYFRLPASIVHVQRDVNIVLMVASTCMLYASARVRGVGRTVALVTVATFLMSWCVLLVPVFTPVLSDHLAIFTSSLSLLLWATGRYRALYAVVAMCVWIMPTASLVPLALLVMREEQRVVDRIRFPLWTEAVFALVAIMACGVVYLWKGPGLLQGVDTHVFDFARNPDGELTGNEDLLPFSILVALAMAFLCIRTAATFLGTHWRQVDLKRVVLGLAIALASFALMRLVIDFDKGFSAGQLFDNMSKQVLSAPFKTWVAHTVYFGPAILVAYFFIVFRRAHLPAALSACLIGFLPLLAMGSESRQWIAIFPVAALALCFLPVSVYFRGVLLLVTGCMFWGLGSLNEHVTQAVTGNVGLQHPLWNDYMGRVGPWMTMSVFRHWLLLTILMVGALSLVGSLPSLARARRR